MGKVIAIDGPAGAGKSTVARRLARELGFLHLDTGATYRAVAWAVQNSGLDIGDQTQISELADSLKIEMQGDRIWVNGIEVTEAIRTVEMGKLSSDVSAIPGVRRAMVKLQRMIGESAEPGAVAEGRDMGTAVFPRTGFKFYLDASLEERTRRRLKDLADHGQGGIKFEGLKEQIRLRDHNDSHRQDSPLRIAADAIVIDTTDMSIEQVVELLVKHIRAKL